jgi:DNA-binding transcriptional LysR family regulator
VSTSVVSGCDAPPVLEFGDEVLDLMALAIERLVISEGNVDAWPFIDRDGAHVAIAPSGDLRLGDGQMALAGVGVARLAPYHLGADLAAGWLVPLLGNHDCGAVENIHAVFVGPGRHVPARVRVLLDFLAERLAQGLA